jgi:hypothetical protein
MVQNVLKKHADLTFLGSDVSDADESDWRVSSVRRRPSIPFHHSIHPPLIQATS